MLDGIRASRHYAFRRYQEMTYKVVGSKPVQIDINKMREVRISPQRMKELDALAAKSKPGYVHECGKLPFYSFPGSQTNCPKCGWDTASAHCFQPVNDALAEKSKSATSELQRIAFGHQQEHASFELKRTKASLLQEHASLMATYLRLMVTNIDNHARLTGETVFTNAGMSEPIRALLARIDSGI
jgi:hypothetical protein